jgi:hypothetical protein
MGKQTRGGSMNFRGDVGKRPSLCLLAVCTLILPAMPVRGQELPAPPGEAEAVVRISKELIDDVVSRVDIAAAIPFDARVVGFEWQGVINGRGKMSVELVPAPGEAAFIVNGRGTAETNARGVHAPLVAGGRAWGPFTSRTLVRFDGRKFTRVETTPWAEVHAELDCVGTRRGGPVGRVGGRLLLPVGELLVPRAERQATPIGEYYLKNYVDQLAEKIVGKLDETTPVEKSLNRLYPETKDWVFQLSADSKFIQAVYGPRGAAAPVLPENPGRVENERLELWVRTTSKEAQDLAKLTKQPLAKALVQKYLEATMPELAALAEERSVNAVGPWLVISVGAPKAP